MSSLLNHGLQGVIASTLLFLIFASFVSFLMTSPFILLMVALFGGVCTYYSTLPDIYGIAGGSAKGNWNLYNNAHNQNPANVKVYNKYKKNPLYYLHVWQDKYMHQPGQRWWVWNERLWVEVVTDILWLSILIFLYGWWAIFVISVAFGGTLGLALTIISDVHNGKIPEAKP